MKNNSHLIQLLFSIYLGEVILFITIERYVRAANAKYKIKCKIEVSTDIGHGNLYEIRHGLRLKGTEIPLRTR